MEEQKIKLKTVKLAKEKGCDLDLYDESVWHFYINGDLYAANYDCREEHPDAFRKILCTQSLLQKWLRDEFSLEIFINKWFQHEDESQWYVTRVYKWEPNESHKYHIECGNYLTYEKALEAGLVEALKLIENEYKR